MRIITANVNGISIRAAARRGGLAWLPEQEADILSLQEIRSRVAILPRTPLLAVRPIAHAEFAGQGRWLEVDVATQAGAVTVASTYVHTGEALTPRQDEKYAFLAAIEDRLAAWGREGALAVVTGDLNVAHTEADLTNWRGNLGKAGFLDQERSTLDRWCSAHVVDVHRHLHGPGPGPYTWWSWRGRAFDNDAGWRIDYQLATPPLADRAVRASVGRADTYALRWSDHAPVVVDYELGDEARR